MYIGTYRWEEHVGDVEAHDGRQVPNHDQHEWGVPIGASPNIPIFGK